MKHLFLALVCLLPVQAFGEVKGDGDKSNRGRITQLEFKLRLMEDDIRKLNMRIHYLESDVSYLNKRLRLYEPEQRHYPWEPEYLRRMHKEFERFPMGRVMREMAEEFEDDE